MKKIRILAICFEQQILPKDLPKFRGAIIRKTEQKSILFHNHIGNDKLRYRYPLIQYKVIGKQGCLICIDEGTEEIHSLLGLRNLDILIGDQPVSLSIDSLTAKNFQLGISDGMHHFSIHNWLALNEANYQKYMSLRALTDRVAFLERILTGNIISFAKGVGYTVEDTINLTIDRVPDEKRVPYKGNMLTAFDLDFTANICLPDYIGLGKGVSIGFGMVKHFGKTTK